MVKRVYGYVWCLDCGEPHEASYGKIHIDFFDCCPTSEDAYAYYSNEWPEEIQSETFAEYAGRFVDFKYRIMPRRVKYLPCHRPMYYKEEVE